MHARKHAGQAVQEREKEIPYSPRAVPENDRGGERKKERGVARRERRPRLPYERRKSQNLEWPRLVIEKLNELGYEPPAYDKREQQLAQKQKPPPPPKFAEYQKQSACAQHVGEILRDENNKIVQ